MGNHFGDCGRFQLPRLSSRSGVRKATRTSSKKTVRSLLPRHQLSCDKRSCPRWRGTEGHRGASRGTRGPRRPALPQFPQNHPKASVKRIPKRIFPIHLQSRFSSPLRRSSSTGEVMPGISSAVQRGRSHCGLPQRRCQNNAPMRKPKSNERHSVLGLGGEQGHRASDHPCPQKWITAAGAGATCRR